MSLKVRLDVKFRAFLITFANYSQSWAFPLPAQLPAGLMPSASLIHFSRQGVSLTVEIG